MVGVHNGIIFNDDELMEQHGFERAEPRMTVDSEAIFALAEPPRAPRRARAAERLDGDRLDRRAPAGTVFLARGVGRPLWIGTGREELFFASTKAALEVVEKFLRLKLRKREVAEGTLSCVARRRDGSGGALQAGPELRGEPPPRRARAARGRVLPQAARRARPPL